MKTPDITPAQLVAITSAIVDTALAFGVQLSVAQQHALLADAGLVGVLLLSDTAIRRGRAAAAAGAQRAAGPLPDTLPPIPDLQQS